MKKTLIAWPRFAASTAIAAAFALASAVSSQQMVRPGEAPPSGGQRLAAPAVEIPVTPQLETRAKEIVALIAGGDVAKMSAYAGENIAPDAARGPMGPMTPTQFLWTLWYQARGAELIGLRSTAPSTVTARYRAPMTGATGAVDIRLDDSGRIIGLSPRRPSVDVPALADDKARADYMAALVGRMAAADYFSGAVLIARGDRTILSKGFGKASRETGAANTPDTRFNIASMNKMFTAVAIMQLVEAGKLSLEDPVAKFLPDFPDPESAKRIRIKHLLTHTSGLGSYFSPAFFAKPMTSYRGLADYLAVARGPLMFEPGERWFYSNTGMLVAGRIVEIASGEDYYAYIRKHIYRPAGMTRTDSYELDRTADRALGYEVSFGPDGGQVGTTDAATPVRGSPAGGGLATATDLMRFSTALRAGKLVKPATLAAMLAPHPELNAPAQGYGFDLGGRLAPRGRKVAGHPGDTPGACAIYDMILDTPEPYTVVILSNGTMMGNCHLLAQTAYALFKPAEVGAAVPAPVKP